MLNKDRYMIKDPAILRRMECAALQMTGMPVDYPKPTPMQRFKRWIRYQNKELIVIYSLIALFVSLLYIVPPEIKVVLAVGFVLGIVAFSPILIAVLVCGC